MAAVTQAQVQPLYQGAQLVKVRKVAASVTVWAGTLAVSDSGQIKVFTVALYAAGAKFLGFPVSDVVNPTAAMLTDSSGFVFRRGCPMSIGAKAGDEPDETNVGGLVYLKDNFSIGKTSAVGDLAVTLLESTETTGTGKYLIQLP